MYRVGLGYKLKEGILASRPCSQPLNREARLSQFVKSKGTFLHRHCNNVSLDSTHCCEDRKLSSDPRALAIPWLVLPSIILPLVRHVVSGAVPGKGLQTTD